MSAAGRFTRIRRTRRPIRNGRPGRTEKVIWFVVGEICGLITAAVISGGADRLMRWRKRKHEQKSVQNFYMRSGGDHHGAGRSGDRDGTEKDLGQ